MMSRLKINQIHHPLNFMLRFPRAYWVLSESWERSCSSMSC
jgi:hypothetical protein